MNEITQSNWDSFVYIFSWHEFRDTLPGLIWLFLFSLWNGIYDNNLKFHLERFLFYTLLCYFLYSIHTWSGSLEQNIFGKFTHYFDVGIWLSLIVEFTNFYKIAEIKLLIVMPLISYVMSKINSFIQTMEKLVK